LTTTYFHCDVTGPWLWELPADAPQQPHLLRLSLLKADSAGGEATPEVLFVKPEASWTLDGETLFHAGLDGVYVTQYGQPQAVVLRRFLDYAAVSERFVAYNAEFHTRVLRRTAADLGVIWPDMEVECAMRRSTNIVRVPKMQPGGGFKWPKMSEAHQYFAGTDIPHGQGAEIDGAELVMAVRLIDTCLDSEFAEVEPR
jgi:hypothetical protein